MGTGNDDAESEEPDVLMAVGPHAEEAMGLQEDQIQALRSITWQGTANQLSPSHLDWGVETTAAAARKPRSRQPYERRESPQPSCSYDHRSVSLRTVVRQRRSAVAMDRTTHITRDTFYRILQRTLAVPGSIPLSTLPWASHIHLAIFVHRVKDLPAGLYIFVRDTSQTRALRAAFTKVDQWQRPAECPPQLELYCLIEAEAQQSARQVSCHQDIASDGCFSLGMIAEYEAPIEQNGPWFYPRLFWEAGMIGQVLYLEAEAAGIRSTGIGCYFDDPMHRVLGLQDLTYQDLYHFTVGGPIDGNGNQKRDPCGHVKRDPQVRLRQYINPTSAQHYAGGHPRPGTRCRGGSPWSRSTPRDAACGDPEGRRWRWSASNSTADSPPRAAIAFTSSPRTRDSGPARHPESGGPAASRERRGRPGHPVQAGPQGP